ncbi:MAG: aldose 1-epimerase [Cytophagaceae bacterium]|nr:aldose 1-epimerase [Cytophagaceae bacterium]
MFSIATEAFGELEVVKLVNNKTGEFASVIPGFSATINELGLYKKDKIFNVIDGSKNYNSLMSEGRAVFKGSKLFPFPNRINNGDYIFEGKKYSLKKNFPSEGHAIHGLLLEAAFTINAKHASEKEASLELKYHYKEKNTGYPFELDLTVIFMLTDEGLKCTTVAKNVSDKNIPVGDGWHPYFQTGSKANDLTIKIPSECLVETDSRGIPTEKTIHDPSFIKGRQIADHHFDHCYILAEKNGISSIELYDQEKNITLIVWQETGVKKYNYVQIYSPPSRKCIAIEPMSCMPDAFNNKNGLIVLKPGEKINLSFGVKLR